VHWGVARDRPSLQHVRWPAVHRDCLSRSSNIHAFSQLSLRVLFITTIRLRWRLLMMTAVIESDYVTYLSALNMRSDWFFLVLRAYHFLTDNSLQSADKDQRKSHAVAEKLHGQKFDTYRNLQRHRAVHPAIARLLYNKCACLRPLVWFQTALDYNYRTIFTALCYAAMP